MELTYEILELMLLLLDFEAEIFSQTLNNH